MRSAPQNIGFSLVDQNGQLGDLGSELIGHLAPLGAGHFGILLGKGGAEPTKRNTINAAKVLVLILLPHAVPVHAAQLQPPL
jgi:hypothetical protein